MEDQPQTEVNDTSQLVVPQGPFKRSLADVKLDNKTDVDRPFAGVWRPGRPSMLTMEAIEFICEALMKGHHPEFVCAGAGIALRTFYHWLKQGRKDYNALVDLDATGEEIPEEMYTLHFELFIKVQQSMYLMQEGPLQAIKDAWGEDWRAAAHFLERRVPKHWARKAEIKQAETTNVTNVQTVIMVPKRADDVAGWQTVVEDKKNGQIAMEPQKALPGSSSEEEPVAKEAVFEDIIGIAG